MSLDDLTDSELIALYHKAVADLLASEGDVIPTVFFHATLEELEIANPITV